MPGPGMGGSAGGMVPLQGQRQNSNGQFSRLSVMGQEQGYFVAH